jgi:hypothetical protein
MDDLLEETSIEVILAKGYFGVASGGNFEYHVREERGTEFGTKAH